MISGRRGKKVANLNDILDYPYTFYATQPRHLLNFCRMTTLIWIGDVERDVVQKLHSQGICILFHDKSKHEEADATEWAMNLIDCKERGGSN